MNMRNQKIVFHYNYKNSLLHFKWNSLALLALNLWQKVSNGKNLLLLNNMIFRNSQACYSMQLNKAWKILQRIALSMNYMKEPLLTTWNASNVDMKVPDLKTSWISILLSKMNLTRSIMTVYRKHFKFIWNQRSLRGQINISVKIVIKRSMRQRD